MFRSIVTAVRTALATPLAILRESRDLDEQRKRAALEREQRWAREGEEHAARIAELDAEAKHVAALYPHPASVTLAMAA